MRNTLWLREGTRGAQILNHGDDSKPKDRHPSEFCFTNASGLGITCLLKQCTISVTVFLLLTLKDPELKGILLHRTVFVYGLHIFYSIASSVSFVNA